MQILNITSRANYWSSAVPVAEIRMETGERNATFSLLENCGTSSRELLSCPMVDSVAVYPVEIAALIAADMDSRGLFFGSYEVCVDYIVTMGWERRSVSVSFGVYRCRNVIGESPSDWLRSHFLTLSESGLYPWPGASLKFWPLSEVTQFCIETEYALVSGKRYLKKNEIPVIVPEDFWDYSVRLLDLPEAALEIPSPENADDRLVFVRISADGRSVRYEMPLPGERLTVIRMINSFGVPEYMAVRASTTEKPVFSSEIAVIHRRLRSYDVESHSEFTTELAPLPASDARSLLELAGPDPITLEIPSGDSAVRYNAIVTSIDFSLSESEMASPRLEWRPVETGRQQPDSVSGESSGIFSPEFSSEFS